MCRCFQSQKTLRQRESCLPAPHSQTLQNSFINLFSFSFHNKHVELLICGQCLSPALSLSSRLLFIDDVAAVHRAKVSAHVQPNAEETDHSANGWRPILHPFFSFLIGSTKRFNHNFIIVILQPACPGRRTLCKYEVLTGTNACMHINTQKTSSCSLWSWYCEGSWSSSCFCFFI